jgi:hypothetical protein
MLWSSYPQPHLIEVKSIRQAKTVGMIEGITTWGR